MGILYQLSLNLYSIFLMRIRIPQWALCGTIPQPFQLFAFHSQHGESIVPPYLWATP
jgi:hypothetical protein